jgi:Caspase domain
VLVLLAAAVTSVSDHRYIDIDCAWADAYKIYDTLARVGGSMFDHCRSAVLTDPTNDDFIGVVTSSAMSLSPDDQLIVYFTGHADEHEGMTRLLFGNADGRGRGRVRVDVLAAPLVDASTRALLILDCCNSGNALTVADTRDALLPRRISVMASSGPYLPSIHGPDASAFTLAFCRALDSLAEQNERLTLSAIAELIETDVDFEGKVYVNHRSGYAEDTIMHDAPSYLIPEDAAQKFLDAVTNTDVRTREALWYALQDMPIPLQLGVLVQSCEENNVGEASWLVRRAMGSVIGALPAHSRNRHDLMMSLIEEGRNWMHQAVGIIAARDEILNDETIQARVLEILRSDVVIDVIWLAHLYLADAAPEDALEAALRTGLARTSWGTLDIFRRHFPRYRSELSSLVTRLRDAADGDAAILGPLRTHLLLSGLSDQGLEGARYSEELVQSTTARSLYRKRPRGKIRQPKAKWLLSYLYGSWRDNIGADALNALDDVPPSLRTRAAEMLAEIPAVEIRMALAADALSTDQIDTDVTKIREWSVADLHPWVRREALSNDPERSSVAFTDTVERKLYPGALDLAIRGAELHVLPDGFVQTLDLPTYERKAFELYLRTT